LGGLVMMDDPLDPGRLSHRDHRAQVGPQSQRPLTK